MVRSDRAACCFEMSACVVKAVTKSCSHVGAEPEVDDVRLRDIVKKEILNNCPLRHV